MRAGQGFLAIWSDAPPEHETDYLHWMTREHAQERLAIPGFRNVRLFRSTRTEYRRFFIPYTLESAEVMASPACLAQLNDPSPWSQRIMPMLVNFRRGGGRVELREGRGQGTLVTPTVWPKTGRRAQSPPLWVRHTAMVVPVPRSNAT